tara:strand:- start:1266 stop:2081 length:816 start_codon:yes stop_codon:yes gene_type:complete
MGWLRKVGKKIGKGIRKVGREIKRGFQNVFQKLGPVGTFAMWFILPSIAGSWSSFLDQGIAAGTKAGASFTARAAGTLAKAASGVTNGVGNVYNGITSAMSGTLDLITKPFSKKGQGLGTSFENYLNNKRQDFNLKPNESWKDKLAEQIKVAGTETPKGIELQNILDNKPKAIDPNKIGKTTTGELVKQSLVTGGVNLGLDLFVADAMEEEDTGARGVVYSNVSEQGNLPIRDLTLERNWRDGGYNGNMTANSMTNSNFYGVDQVFNQWSR